MIAMEDDDHSDPEDDDPVEMSKAELLKEEAVSRHHLLTHIPRNPYCPSCIWAKTLRKQQRKKRNKAPQKLKPYSEPKAFGGLCTMDHWFAADELSRGLYGETACVTFRDRFTDYIACAGVHEKATEHVVHFLTQLKHPRESMSTSGLTAPRNWR